MQKQPKPSAALCLILVFAFMATSLACVSLFAVSTLRTVSTSQELHLQSFVPAKRLTSSFEREMLNARISFIYFVTIQKPGALAMGWQRYRNAEARLADLAALVDQHAELINLTAPVARLRADLATYNEALSATLALVQQGERSGPRYDAQVREWAARGAVMVGDAASVEALCFNSGEANTARTVSLVRRGQHVLVLLLSACLFLGSILILWLLRHLSAAAPAGLGADGLPRNPRLAHAGSHKIHQQW